MDLFKDWELPEERLQMPPNPVVIVTGASRGIGRAIAEAFAEKGARLAICSKTDRIFQAAEHLEKIANRVMARICDVSDYYQVKEFVEEVVEEYGEIHVLVNNASILIKGKLGETDPEEFQEIMRVNVNGYFFMIREVLPQMIKQRFGVIINISSGAGHGVIPSLVPYCITKSAEIFLTEGIAAEYGYKGIRAYAVCPGETNTDMLRQVIPEEEIREDFVLDPRDVAEKVLDIAYGHERLPNGGYVDVTKLKLV